MTTNPTPIPPANLLLARQSAEIMKAWSEQLTIQFQNGGVWQSYMGTAVPNVGPGSGYKWRIAPDKQAMTREEMPYVFAIRTQAGTNEQGYKKQDISDTNLQQWANGNYQWSTDGVTWKTLWKDPK